MSGWSEEWTTVELRGCLPLKYMLEVDAALHERYWYNDPIEDPFPDTPTPQTLPLKWLQQTYDFIFGPGLNDLRGDWYKHIGLTTLDRAGIAYFNSWDVPKLEDHLGISLVRPTKGMLMRPLMINLYKVLNQLRWRILPSSNYYRYINLDYGLIEESGTAQVRYIEDVFNSGNWNDMAATAAQALAEPWVPAANDHFDVSRSHLGGYYGLAKNNEGDDGYNWYSIDTDEDEHSSLSAQVKQFITRDPAKVGPLYALNVLRTGGAAGYNWWGATMLPLIWDKFLIEGYTVSYDNTDDEYEYRDDHFRDRAYRISEIFAPGEVPEEFVVYNMTDADINELDTISPPPWTGDYPDETYYRVFSFGTSMGLIARHDVEGGFQYRDW